jgi:hypothetical protein
MTWEEYCSSKNIDSEAFRLAEEEKWSELKNIFEQVHPKSFTEQKKFLINDLRRKYLLKTAIDASQKPEKAPMHKQAVKIMPKQP